VKYFSNFRGFNCQKTSDQNQIQTWRVLSWLNTRTRDINWYILFYKSKSDETEFFSNVHEEIIEPWPNSNLTCLILRCIYMSTLSWMCITLGEIMNGNFFFSKLKGYHSKKNHRIWLNSNLNCIFLWHIRMLNLSSMCLIVEEMMSGNWIFKNYFQS
jgi:hypothetical protein